MSYVQFKAIKIYNEKKVEDCLDGLNFIRDVLIRKNLLGFCKTCEKQCGFGNISFRTHDGFLITGTKTGHLERLSVNDVSVVTLSELFDNLVY